MPIIDISNVSEDALNLVNMMDGVLDRVVTTFQSYNVPLPDRQYWAVGQSVIDCEQLTVTLINGYLGPPGSQQSLPQRCNVPRTVVLLITIARAIPVVSLNGRPPTADKIREAAQISAIDAWVLLQSVNLLDQWDNTSYGVGVIGTIETPPPEGGFQMITMQLVIAVP